MPYIGKTTDGFGIRERFTYLASAGATSISGADANGKTLLYEDPEYVDVFLNGIRLKKGTDYNTSTANTIAGLAALAENDEVEVIVQDVFTLADMVSANTGGDFRGSIAIQKDSGVLSFGADKEITVTHSADTGLVFKNTNTGDDKPFTLTLQTGETDIAVNDKLGVINFQAPDEGTGTDAILVAAGIEAVSEGDFSSSSNATKLSFKTAASAAAAETMSLSSAGNLTVSGTFTGGGTMITGGNIIIPDDGTIGSASDQNAVAISAAGVVTISTNTDSTSSTSGALIAHSAGFADDVFIGDDLEVGGGVIALKNTGSQSQLRLYCESSNAHYAALQAPAHSDFSGNTVLTLPATTDTIAGIASTQTFTNKTLTTPVIAEITSGSTITLNATTDIVLDADGDEVIFKDGSTNVGHVSMDSDNLTIKSLVSDKDMIFQGNDGGSAITALTLDMSAAGAATFNGAITGGGLLTTGGNIVIPDAGNIGSASDTDAISISSGGVVNFSARPTFAASLTIQDGGQIGSASDTDAIAIASNGQVTLTQTLIGTALDISGDIDVDGTTNLDVVDIDGAVDMASTLQVDGAITSSAGMTITTADNTAQLTLVSTDADADKGPVFQLKRDSGSPADNDVLGRVLFQFDDDGGNETTAVQIEASATDVSDGSEDASLNIVTMVGGTTRSRLKFNSTETVFNDDGQDLDFRVESNGNANLFFVNGGTNRVGIGTNSPDLPLHLSFSGQDAQIKVQSESDGNASRLLLFGNNVAGASYNAIQSHVNGDSTVQWEISGAKASAEDKMLFSTGGVERMRLNNDRRVFFDTTTANVAAANGTGVVLNDNSAGSAYSGTIQASASGNGSLFLNRGSDDGPIAIFKQAGTDEGSISVSGNNVAYNTFTGTHWSRLTDNSKPTILKGTIVETIDEMCDWYNAKFTVAETDDIPEYEMRDPISLPDGKSEGDKVSHTYLGTTYDDAVIIKEYDNKHVKCKISDTADSKRVYGVYHAWDNDDDTVNDMYVAAVGTHVVRINKDVTVEAGDLLSSNGDGTAKVQDDDIIRSKTIGKVLTNIKQETYSDGSYTVPCALYCG